MMLPLVVRFNGQDAAARRAYAELASGPEIACVSNGHERALEALIARLESWLNLAGIPRSLADCGVKRSQIKTLAAEAARQWTAGFNPRPIRESDFVGLYEAAFEQRGDGDGA
jgi:alcohol dehydrogenase